MIESVPILGLGHPRTGTGYVGKLLESWGLEVGHEEHKRDGIVSWLLTKPIGPYMWQKGFNSRPEYQHLIYNVRDPRTSLPSIVYTESTNLDSMRFRRRFLKLNNNSVLENAIDSIIGFHEIIMNLNPFLFRIEYDHESLYNYLNKDYNIKYVEHTEKFNTRKHKTFEEMVEHLNEPSQQHIDRLNKFCEEVGYESIYFKT